MDRDQAQALQSAHDNYHDLYHTLKDEQHPIREALRGSKDTIAALLAQVERLRAVARAAPDGIDAVWAAVEALHDGDLGERSSAPD